MTTNACCADAASDDLMHGTVVHCIMFLPILNLLHGMACLPTACILAVLCMPAQTSGDVSSRACPQGRHRNSALLIMLCLFAGGDAEEGSSGLTGKQQKLLRQCKLPLRVVDTSFLEAAGPDKQAALVQALQVSPAN